MKTEFINFSEITYKTLKKIGDFKLVKNCDIFKEWFNFNYEINKYDEEYLIKLIENNRYNIADYSEYQLLAHFIVPILNKVHFYSENYREWYQPEISGNLNGYILKGKPDFMVASGVFEPEIPFFFLQEFKKQKTNSDPLRQLLAQMAVAMENNKVNQMKGAYNIGRIWAFIIMNKYENGKYKYHESEFFNSCKIDELKQIYINLKAVKHKYCKL